MRTRRSLVGAIGAAILVAGVPVAAVSAAGDPQVSVGDASVAEPSNRTGTVTIEVPVTVHGGTAGASSVAWRTVAGTASTADFVNASGTLSLAPGATGGSIAIQVRADRTA